VKNQEQPNKYTFTLVSGLFWLVVYFLFSRDLTSGFSALVIMLSLIINVMIPYYFSNIIGHKLSKELKKNQSSLYEKFEGSLINYKGTYLINPFRLINDKIAVSELGNSNKKLLFIYYDLSLTSLISIVFVLLLIFI